MAPKCMRRCWTFCDTTCDIRAPHKSHTWTMCSVDWESARRHRWEHVLWCGWAASVTITDAILLLGFVLKTYLHVCKVRARGDWLQHSAKWQVTGSNPVFTSKKKIRCSLVIWEEFTLSSRRIMFKNFFKCFIYFWDRDRARAGEGQRERETQNPKQAPGSELSAQRPIWGSNSQTRRSWPEPKSDA